MKKLLELMLLGLAGCAYMFPSHQTKFSGVHNGKLMYELQCNDQVDCIKDSNRVCQGHKWEVVFHWSFDGDRHYMVECQREKF